MVAVAAGLAGLAFIPPFPPVGEVSLPPLVDESYFAGDDDHAAGGFAHAPERDGPVEA
jgi:hypothetical protein